MIAVGLRREGSPASQAEWFGYRIAGHDVCCDFPLLALPGFASGACQPPIPFEAENGSDAGEQVFRGPAFVCGSIREVACALSARGYDLTIADVGRFLVARNGSHVTCVASEFPPDDPAVAEAVLGPALTLALALRGTFCLHASAVASERGALLFLGASGAGKSTLAARLSGTGRASALLTDDITPMVPSPAGLEVRPRFPQLKLPAERQPSAVAPESLALGGAYLLDLPDPAAGATVSVERLGPAAGLAALVRHTVAVRLFGRELLASYLGALAAAPGPPVRRLRYPRRYEAIPAVAAAIEADLGVV